jgi:hypothetical protein
MRRKAASVQGDFERRFKDVVGAGFAWMKDGSVAMLGGIGLAIARCGRW